MNMLAPKLLTSPIRQTVGPTTCRALAHTDIQFPDHAAHKRPSTLDNKKKNIDSEDERKVSSYHLMTATAGVAGAIATKSAVTKLVASATVYFDQFSNYCQMIASAKSLARRSILIDHCGLEHIDLKTEFNNVEHVYSIEKETKRGLTRLSLIEFKTENDAENIAKRAKHNEGLLPVPLKIFRYNGRSSSNLAQKNLPFPIDNVRLSYKNELSPNFNSYADLVSNNMMSLVALKMRFITLVNFERILCSGMFEEYELMPFGSSVIDMGCDTSDLDLVVTRKEDHHQVILDLLSDPKKLYRPEPHSQLVHLDKSLYSETKDNSGVRGTMRWFDYILREYMPLTDGYGVQFVSRAKVPIIKFTARITSIDCDLSFNFGLDHRERDLMMTNYSGIITAQILYSLCRNNNLFTAVVIYLRIFAKITSITSKGPSTGMTNFQLLSLIIFYLQQISLTSHVAASKSSTSSSSSPPPRQSLRSKHDSRQEFRVESSQSAEQRPIIPPLKHLLNAKFSLTEHAVSLDDSELNQLAPEVIIGFFEFYSNFDFNGHSLNLYESAIERKLDNSPLYVLNPIDRTKNVCHNVTRKGLETFVKQVRLAVTSIRSSKHECPLSLIRNLLLRYRQQSGKMQKLNFEQFDQDLQSNTFVTSDGIAQDVCR